MTKREIDNALKRINRRMSKLYKMLPESNEYRRRVGDMNSFGRTNVRTFGWGLVEFKRGKATINAIAEDENLQDLLLSIDRQTKKSWGNLRKRAIKDIKADKEKKGRITNEEIIERARIIDYVTEEIDNFFSDVYAEDEEDWTEAERALVDFGLGQDKHALTYKELYDLLQQSRK